MSENPHDELREENMAATDYYGEWDGSSEEEYQYSNGVSDNPDDSNQNLESTDCRNTAPKTEYSPENLIEKYLLMGKTKLYTHPLAGIKTIFQPTVLLC